MTLVHRILIALAERPRSSADLAHLLDAPCKRVGRTLSELREREYVEQGDYVRPCMGSHGHPGYIWHRTEKPYKVRRAVGVPRKRIRPAVVVYRMPECALAEVWR